MAAVLDVAAERFAERGPSRVSIREIAQGAQVNHALVHRHFKTKEALLRAVMDRLTPSRSERITPDTEWAEAMALIFASGTAHATYARMLAWLLLEADLDIALLERFPAVDALVQLASDAQPAAGDRESPDDDDARVTVLAVELMALGWQLFGPFLVRMLQLEHLGDAEVERRLVARAASM